jgi:hypothetical protein
MPGADGVLDVDGSDLLANAINAFVPGELKPIPRAERRKIISFHGEGAPQNREIAQRRRLQKLLRSRGKKTGK